MLAKFKTCQDGLELLLFFQGSSMVSALGTDFFDSMPTQKATVYFTCQPKVKASLQAWADKEGRSLSNLVERIVLAALEAEPSAPSTTDKSGRG
jgi:hypothetical protein